jgi:Family of unknown function (DUF6920)
VREARWHGATKNAVLRARSVATTPGPPGDLGEVPDPVRLYLRRAIPSGAPAPRLVRVHSRGEFLAGRWRPFHAAQYFTVQPPAFVWDARIRLLPGVTILVRDSFRDGRGCMRGAALGAIPIVSAEGAGEIAVAALQRYLAEAVWFPLALLPENGVQWTALDRSRARATLAAGTVTASLEFTFGTDGMVREVFAPERVRAVGKRMVPTPWRGRHEEYRELGGWVIPTRAEVEWMLPGGPQPYWKGEITEVQHDPAI